MHIKSNIQKINFKLQKIAPQKSKYNTEMMELFIKNIREYV